MAEEENFIIKLVLELLKRKRHWKGGFSLLGRVSFFGIKWCFKRDSFTIQLLLNLVFSL